MRQNTFKRLNDSKSIPKPGNTLKGPGPQANGDRGHLTLEHEDQRREQDLNLRLFQALELKLRCSEVFNEMFARFMELYKMHEVQDFNRQVDENTHSNFTSQLNVYKKLKLFSNTMQNERIELVCFKEMIRATRATILGFVRPAHKQFGDLEKSLGLQKVKWDEFKQRYFIRLCDLQTALQLKSVITQKLRSRPPAKECSDSVVMSKVVRQRKAKASEIRVKTYNDASLSQSTVKSPAKSPMLGLVRYIDSELESHKEFGSLRRYIKGIIANTEQLKAMPLDTLDFKSTNETLNEKYHRLNLIKKIVKTNLIFYLMMQIGNKQAFIKMADQLPFK